MYSDDRIAELQKTVADSIAASNLMSSPEGKLLLDYIESRVSNLVGKMTATTPLDEREYNSIHGGIKELKIINNMIQLKASLGAAAQEELDVIRQDSNT